MSEGSEPGTPPVYGGRRRTRGMLSRIPDRQTVDDAHPTLPDPVRYFAATGQIPVVRAPHPVEAPGSEPEPQRGSGTSFGIRLSSELRADHGAHGVSLIPEDTSPRGAVRPPSAPASAPSAEPAPITINGAALAHARANGAAPTGAPAHVHTPGTGTTGTTGVEPAATEPAGPPRASADNAWLVQAPEAGQRRSATMIAPLHGAPALQGRDTLVAPPLTPEVAPKSLADVPATPRPGAARELDPRHSRSPADGARRSPRTGRLHRLVTAPATWLGIAAVLICVVAGNIPAFSLDEAVTIESARRDWGGMWTLVESGHAANALWVWITHLWIGAFGAGEVSLRLLPALAAGMTVAGLTSLATRLSGARAGLFAGIIAALLPRLTLQGSEASGIALGTAFATWATVALVWAVGVSDPIPRFDVPKRLVSHRNQARRRQAVWRHIGRWTIVALLLTLGALVHAPVIFMALVHPIFIMAAGARRGALRGSAIASLCAVVLTAPLLVTIALQDWWVLGRASERPLSAWAWITAPAMTDALLAVPAAIMAAAILGVGLARIRHVIARSGTTSLALAAVWIIVPTAAFGLLQLFAPHTYAPEYLAFTAPAVALLLGVALPAGPTWVWITLLVIMLQSLAPPLLFQKLPTARGGSDDRATAQYIGLSSTEGDGIVFSDALPDGTKSSRTMLSTYPEPFAQLVDLTLSQSGEAAGTLWDASVDISTVPNRLDGIDRVWVLRPVTQPMTSKTPEFAIYADRGFAVVSSAVFAEFIVYELVRTDAFGLDDEGNPPAPDPLPPLPSPVPTDYDDPQDERFVHRPPRADDL